MIDECNTSQKPTTTSSVANLSNTQEDELVKAEVNNEPEKTNESKDDRSSENDKKNSEAK